MRVILFFILGLCSFHSLALGKLGHQLVCQIAYQHLSPEKQQTIDKLLASLPNEQKQLINSYLYQPKDSKITFAKSCVWADAIKKIDKYKPYSSWHYVNTERDKLHITENTCTKNCVISAINLHTKQLHNKSLWKKTQALMFLGHWLGDIHQPLHVSYASDWGGNKITVNSPTDKCTNIHWLWDSCLLNREKLTWPDWLQTLSTQWQQAPIKQWQQSKPWQWADESLQIVRQKALGYCHLQNNKCIANTTEENAHLYNEKYQQHYAPVLETRMLQAAARLTQLLTDNL